MAIGGGGNKGSGVELNATISQLREAVADFESVLESAGNALRENLGPSANNYIRNLSGSMRELTRSTNNVKTAADRVSGFGASTIQGARLSSALSQMTSGGGGGRRGPNMGARAGRFTAAALSPLQSLPGMVQGIVQMPGKIGGKILRAFPGVGPLLGKTLAPLIENLSGAAGPVAGAATAMALDFGGGFVRGAIGSRSAFESRTRFLSPGMRRNIGSLGGGLRHGYGALETAAHRESVMRALGGGRFTATERLGGGDRGIEGVFQGLSNKMRQPISSLVDFGGVARAGGMGLAQTNEILQKIHQGVMSGGAARNSPEYMFRVQEQIRTNKQFLANQVALTGRANPYQSAAAQSMMSRLTGQFSPQQAGAATLMLQQGSLAPGGGDAGQLFMMRALGFANPMLERYKETAEKMGMDPSMFRRRNMFEYMRAKEDPATRLSAMMVGLRTEFGDRPDMQAYMLQTLIPQLGFRRAEGIMAAFQGGTGLGSQRILDILSKDTTGVLGIAGAPSAGGTGTGMTNVKLLEKYHNFLMKVGGSSELENLHKAMRAVQMIAGELTMGAIQSLPAGGEALAKKLEAASEKSAKAIAKEIKKSFVEAFEALAKVTKDSEVGQSIKTLIEVLDALIH